MIFQHRTWKLCIEEVLPSIITLPCGEVCVGPRRNDALSRPGFPFRVPDTSRAAKGASAVGKGGRSYLQFVWCSLYLGLYYTYFLKDLKWKIWMLGTEKVGWRWNTVIIRSWHLGMTWISQVGWIKLFHGTFPATIVCTLPLHHINQWRPWPGPFHSFVSFG